MKKWFFTVFLALVTLFAGCNRYSNLIVNNMSDMRTNFFYGKCDEYFCTLSCGMRESEFTYDGISTKKVECGVISLGFYETRLYDKISIILTINGVETEYVLDKSPYEDLFMADIEKALPNDAEIFVNLKNQENNVKLNELSETWEIDYKRAIEIGSTHFEQKLNELYFNKKLNCECYLKIIYNEDFKYPYWYFSIIDRSGADYSILIDTNSGEITEAN